jgi:hypothetical protein
MYGTNNTGTNANRVRREAAVSGSIAANSRSGSRQRDYSPNNTTSNTKMRTSAYSNNSGTQLRNKSNNNIA